MEFPGGKKFAFTIFDDTDDATVETVRPIYELLNRLGLATTKSVWVWPPEGGRMAGDSAHTLADTEYMEFIKQLCADGFEIAFHNASMRSSRREKIISALEHFREAVGYYPRAHANHERNIDNVYWGSDRLDFTWALHKIIRKIRGDSSIFEGHKPGSAYFWGDVCRSKISYVRNFVFREINLLRINPTLPYRDPKRPFVKYWFSSCEGASVEDFNRLICHENQERLEREGGVCIMYTHFAYGFTSKGQVNPMTKELLTELSGRNGWFVPVSTLLDYLRSRQTRETRPLHERLNMELTWFLSKLIHRTS